LFFDTIMLITDLAQ